MKIPISLDRIADAAERCMFKEEMVGFCISCGEEIEPIEPDAEKVRCEYCGEKKVYGAEQLLLMVQP